MCTRVQDINVCITVLLQIVYSYCYLMLHLVVSGFMEWLQVRLSEASRHSKVCGFDTVYTIYQKQAVPNSALCVNCIKPQALL